MTTPKDHEQEEAETGRGGGGSTLSNVLTYGLSGILARALTFFLIPLYTRYLTPADYGVLDLVNQIGIVINTVMMLNGIGIATMTFYLQARTEDRQRHAVSSLVLVMSAGVAISALAVIPLSPVLVRVLHLPVTSWTLILGAITVLGEVLPVVPFYLMQARVESRRFLFWNSSVLLVRLLATIVVVVFFAGGVEGILLVRASVSIAAGSFLLSRELHRYWLRPTRDVVRDILRYCLPFVPTGVFSLLRNGLQRFVLLAHAGAADLGIYALGSTLTGVISLVTIEPYHKVWNAQMYGVYESEGAGRKVGAVATKFATLYLCGAVPLALFGKPVLQILSSDDFVGAHRVFVPLLLFGLIDTFMNIPDQVLLVFHKTKYKPFITGIVAACAVGIYFTAVPRFGILGAAYGLVLTSVIRGAIILAISRRFFTIRYEYGRLATLTILTLVVTGAGLQLADSWLGLGLKAGLQIAWFAGIYALAVVPRAEIHEGITQVRRLLRRGERPA